MATLTPEQREALRDEGEALRLQDPVTSKNYVLIPEELYERVKDLVSPGPVSADEQLAYLNHIYKISGWDDPELDIYNDMK